MNITGLDVVRGERCVLALVRGDGEIRQYEYEQDANINLSVRDAIFKFENGDETTRLEKT